MDAAWDHVLMLLLKVLDVMIVRLCRRMRFSYRCSWSLGVICQDVCDLKCVSVGSTCPRCPHLVMQVKVIQMFIFISVFLGVCVCVFFYVKGWEKEGDREEKQ